MEKGPGMTTTSITVRYDEDLDATVVNVYDMGEIVANHDGTVDLWLNVALARDDEPEFERGLADRGVTLKSAIERLAASVTLGPDDPATIRAALTGV